MHKAYRDLQARVEQASAQNPAALNFIRAIGEIDDLDPLRVAALKAMKRVPAPPLRLLFERQDELLVLSAENLARKRKAAKLTRCATIACPRWVFDPAAKGEVVPGTLKREILELLKESFVLLGGRIALYFPVSFGQELKIHEDPTVHLTIATLPLDNLRVTAGPLLGAVDFS